MSNGKIVEWDKMSNKKMLNGTKRRIENRKDVAQLGKLGMSKVSNVESEDIHIMLKRVKQMLKVRSESRPLPEQRLHSGRH